MKPTHKLMVICLALLGVQSAVQSAIILNSANWTTGGLPAYGVFDSTNNLTFNTANTGNAGQLFAFAWGSMPFAANYATTSDSAVAIGYTTGISTTTITFSQSISDLSLWFNFIDNGATFDFTSLNWTFVAGNNASRVGNTVVSTGTNSSDDGFLINVAGAFGASTPLTFTISKSGSPDTAGFTLSAPAPTSPVPEPGQIVASILLLTGIGSFCLRKRYRLAKLAANFGR